ncbi:MAG: glycosyltransferase family 2 protein [Flavobacteriales bacterium]
MFSILTPTYNRADTLERVYLSLINQTFRDFEWIISDDGSTDETAILVQEWQNIESDFIITYHVLAQNQGKSYAVNEGLALCNRPYTLIADSDDTFAPNTLSDLKIIWDGIDLTENGRKIGAIWTLVQDEEGKLVGEAWPKNFWQVSFKERVLDRKQPIIGEKWHSWRTEVLQKYNIYTNINSHIGPSVTWNRINREYDFLCINIVHRKYWFTDDGLIHEKKSKLKIEKRIYYSALLELKEVYLLDILGKKHYRQLAFNYVKSTFYYSDAKLKLNGAKGYIAWFAFLLVLPGRVSGKIF